MTEVFAMLSLLGIIIGTMALVLGGLLYAVLVAGARAERESERLMAERWKTHAFDADRRQL